MAYDEMKFAEKLELLIQLRDTSQSRLSRQTGIAQSAISEMTKGKRRAYLDQAFLLARALGVSLDYMADDAVDTEPAPPPTVRELAVLEFIRAIGTDEAWRKLVGTPTPTRAVESTPVYPPGPAKPRKKDVG